MAALPNPGATFKEAVQVRYFQAPKLTPSGVRDASSIPFPTFARLTNGAFIQTLFSKTKKTRPTFLIF